MGKPNCAEPGSELHRALERPEWQRFAACRGACVAPVWDHLSRGKAAQARARAICAGCPVRGECLDFAMRLAGDDGELAGIWAGLNERDRAQLRRQTDAQAA